MRGHSRQAGPALEGFTLIELLVALALGLAILIIASDLLISSSRSASDLQGRNELLQESQIAQNYLVGQLREAVYVFPQGAAISLGVDYKTQSPLGGSSWSVGALGAPIVAFVRPPGLVPGAPDPLAPGVIGECAVGLVINEPRACYRFMAYYPVLRSVWMDGAAGSNRPAEDGVNSGRWVLVEYRSIYPIPPTLSELAATGYARRGGEARLLLDYVQPPELTPPTLPALFAVNDLRAGGGGGVAIPRPGDTSVSVNLAVSRRIGRRDVTVPSRGSSGLNSVTTVVVVPRNLGNLPN